MCGIFGAIRLTENSPGTVLAVLQALGQESEERGRDSAGVAFTTAETGAFTPTEAGSEHLRSAATSIDNVGILKKQGLFRSIDFTEATPWLQEANLFLGHTRSATQGSTEDLANASPLAVGALVGTHNGDVDVSSVPGHGHWRQKAIGRTDTEILFWALSRARSDRRRMTAVLRSVRGRAALAFIDRGKPDRLYLARTALSPLCFAYDQHGNFYYASNPDWFRRVQTKVKGVTFTEATLVPEGHLLTVSGVSGGVLNVRRFTPTCREFDLGLLNVAVYRGFTDTDKAADKRLHRHQVAQRLGAWPSLTPLDVRKTQPSPPVNQTSPRTPVPALELSPADDLDTIPVPHNGIDIDEAERLCWHGSEFDFITFETLLTVTREEAEQMMGQLRAG
jgi:glucosamine--fructose-6-phosphate aminotransferase (isomerizing)